MNIIFFGTPRFAEIILNRLKSSPYRPVLIVRAQDVIPFEKMQKMKIALIIAAAYGRILQKKILDLPQYGALNVHPSLLPKYRGPSPIQYAILNGDTKTGITIIKMDEEIDHGPVIANFKCQISNVKTAEALTSELAEFGAKLLIETIPKWVAGEITPQEQIHGDATYTKIVKKEDGHVNWRNPAVAIERQVRAFTPWPGSFTFWNNKRILIISGSVLGDFESQKLTPGTVFAYDGKNVAVQTGEGIFLIEKLQLEGKNKITIKEFLNGYSKIIGATLI